jgi:hypothetical protein
VVENVLECHPQLLFGFGIKWREEKEEKLLEEEVLWALMVFGKMVAEAFDEDRDSKLERFWVRVKVTWIGQGGVELRIFEKLKQLLYELVILQKFIK